MTTENFQVDERIPKVPDDPIRDALNKSQVGLVTYTSAELLSRVIPKQMPGVDPHYNIKEPPKVPKGR